MILFDPDQPEAASGFAELTAVAKMPTRQTLLKHLRAAQEAMRLKGEVTVLLTTDDGIRALNRRFRKKNKATDVLSFPAEPGFGVAGDLAISVDTAARQAEEQGHRLGLELRVLMLHGLLHLAGMDHEADDGAMAKREARLRAKLKLPLGLIERVSLGMAEKAGRGGLKPGVIPPIRQKRRKDGAPALVRKPGGEKQIPFGNDSKRSKSNGKGKGNGKGRSAEVEVSVEPRSQKRDLGHPVVGAEAPLRLVKQIPLKGNDRKNGNNKSKLAGAAR